MKVSRLIVTILCFALILALMATVAFCVATSGNKTVKGSFTLNIPFSKETVSDFYYYNDDYFEKSGTVSNAHLRTMSAVLAFTMGGTSNDAEKTYGVIPENIGFGDVVAYDMDKTEKDTMGVVFARKNVGGKTVVMAALRSDDYRNEWASNMLAGASGDASGFSAAAEKVEARLKTYIKDKNIVYAKYWVMGYSRGGAVANLVARDINKNTEDYKTSTDDIYAYTFEAPNASADDAVYKNIHNIADCRDPVTYVYPQGWGLMLNGVKDSIGNPDEQIMSKKFDLFSSSHSVDNEKVKISEFLSDYSGFLAKNFSRETYSQDVESHASEIMDMYFNLDESQRTAFAAFYKKVVENIFSDASMITTVMSIITSDSDQAQVDAVVELINNNIEKTAGELGKPVSDDDFKIITDSVEPVVSAVLPALKEDFAGIMPLSNAPHPALYYYLTFTENSEKLIKYHYSSNVFKQLKAKDSYYTPAPKLKTSKVSLKAGAASSITVKNKGSCNVSYKSSNSKIASVKNGKVTAMKKGTAKITVTVGKTKLIYTVKVTTSPKLSKTSVKVKKCKTASVKIIGKASLVKNKYINTKIAKIISKTNASSLKVKGLRKGSTTLKVKVNGLTLKLRVKVK